MDKYIASLIFFMQQVTRINNLVTNTDNKDFPDQCIYLEEVQDLPTLESFGTYTSSYNIIFKIFDENTKLADGKVKAIVEEIYSKRLYLELVDRTHKKTGELLLLNSVNPTYSVDRGVSQVSFSYKIVNDLVKPIAYPTRDIKVRLHLKEV